MTSHFAFVDGKVDGYHEDHGKGTDNELVTHCQENRSQPIRDNLRHVTVWIDHRNGNTFIVFNEYDIDCLRADPTE